MNRSRTLALPILAALVVPLCLHTSLSQTHAFLKGADVSFLRSVEEHGGVFRDSGMVKDCLRILKDHGFNAVRLRIWHTPADGYCDLGRTLFMADRAKSLGLRVLLDFHYSDTWADPGHQTKPADWSLLPYNALRDSIRRYTGDVLVALRDQGTIPSIVQIGNEITCGMLWNDGAVCGGFDTSTQWNHFAGLLKSAILGMQDVLPPADMPKVMIHIDRGGDIGGCKWFFDHLIAETVPFDMIGLSYYPWWHGTLDAVGENLDSLSNRYKKEIVIAETAYPWTLQWFDETGNIVGDPGQLLAGYPASAGGQERFLRDVMAKTRSTIGGRASGIFYWAPDWISTATAGSAWENITLFDSAGNALPSLRAFEPSIIASHLDAGWNLVSLPVLTDENRIGELYPESGGRAFVYKAGYVGVDTIPQGKGYWVKSAVGQSFDLRGDSLLVDTFTLSVGWNLVGALSRPLAVTRIIRSPESMLLSPFIGYAGSSYGVTDTLRPGCGYWVKSNQAGNIILRAQ